MSFAPESGPRRGPATRRVAPGVESLEGRTVMATVGPFAGPFGALPFAFRGLPGAFGTAFQPGSFSPWASRFNFGAFPGQFNSGSFANRFSFPRGPGQFGFGSSPAFNFGGMPGGGNVGLLPGRLNFGTQPGGLNLGNLNLGGLAGRLTGPEQRAAIDALNGGFGDEFLALIRQQGSEALSVIRDFASGQRSTFETNGLAVQTPRFESTYTGAHQDQLSATAAGAVFTPGRGLVLGAVLRGPIEEAITSQYIFALDRGAGGNQPVAGHPGIVADALVKITVDANQKATGQIVDLKTGATTDIEPSRIKILGPSLKVTLDPAMIPSTGRDITQYRFAFYTADQGGAIASVVPQTGSIPVAFLTGQPPRRFGFF